MVTNKFIMILIVGLGNPGKKFNGTRHNIGFLVVDEFLKKNDFPDWKKSKSNLCLYTKKEVAGKKIEIIKPLVFMNNSGQVVKSVFKKHNLKLKDILVIHDDIDLPLGKIRIAKDRGAGGHKGVNSIIENLRTKNFIRLRMGIQPETGKPQKIEKYVLQKFSKTEEEIIKSVLKKVCLAIRMILTK